MMCVVVWELHWRSAVDSIRNNRENVDYFLLPEAILNALDTMRALAGKGEVLEVPAGDIIFRSGEAGDCMFGLLEGSVELSWSDGGQVEKIQAGDVFGAGALVTHDHRRFGNARALSPCRVLVMNREKFLFAVQESPMFAIELLGSIEERLRHLKDCLR